MCLKLTVDKLLNLSVLLLNFVFTLLDGFVSNNKQVTCMMYL